MLRGLLWYDKGMSLDVLGAIDRAAKRYGEKFGVAPDTIYLNRAQLCEITFGSAIPSRRRRPLEKIKPRRTSRRVVRCTCRYW